MINRHKSKQAYLKWLAFKRLTAKEAMYAKCYTCRMKETICRFSCPIGVYLIKWGNEKDKRNSSD